MIKMCLPDAMRPAPQVIQIVPDNDPSCIECRRRAMETLGLWK
jgi:hypothetical protein